MLVKTEEDLTLAQNISFSGATNGTLHCATYVLSPPTYSPPLETPQATQYISSQRPNGNRVGAHACTRVDVAAILHETNGICICVSQVISVYPNMCGIIEWMHGKRNESGRLRYSEGATNVHGGVFPHLASPPLVLASLLNGSLPLVASLFERVDTSLQSLLLDLQSARFDRICVGDIT